MDEDPVLVLRDGAVVHAVLNRPAARNALNLAMCHRLRETFAALDADPAVRAVLLRANGPAFCAGADLRERKGRDEDWVRARRIASFAAYDAIERCSKPVVALAHGPVVGSGGEIAMSCDFVVAADDVSFRFPEPHWGTVGATQRLQRVIGKRRAKELLFTSRTMEAEEALSVGLVQRLVPAADLAAAGEKLAAAIAGAPGLAMSLTKQAIDLGSETDLANGIRIEMAAIERCLADGAWREGVGAFNAGARPGPRDGGAAPAGRPASGDRGREPADGEGTTGRWEPVDGAGL
ncbi:enoyl-CoA hydratase/isomerase family protein [Actinomadura graeca]|uniref:Enoyl-CoA hydratase/isomerase family protein n=1 Tax=Actinomadura graeca TaxID=2750812 RepID=A0ABX8QU64_9ACTN|nr:enoyl-CoA hydratase/isomerase family protein [Actinomadura graeca]QXJ21504.1 enoyl-CoA hydratase/isomerase family protein [Actinomadura graeca]